MTAPDAASARAARAAGLLGADLVAWILDSDEPAARFVARTRILHEPEDSPDAAADRQASIATRIVHELVATLPGWATDAFDRRDSVRYLPNALRVLHDLGVRTGDFPGVDAALESLIAHRDRHGRLVSVRPADSARAVPAPALCESHSAIEVALRFGLRDDARVERALEQMLIDMRRSDFGRAWCCEARAGRLRLFSSRDCEMCPHATVLALRALAALPASERPALAEDAARSLLAAWRRRAEARPSGFGHGYQFVTVRWPHLWYDALGVIEAVAPFSDVWSARAGDPASRQAVVELAAALIDANTDSSGRVVPVRVTPGFRDLSIGRKGEPSPLASALVRAALEPLMELADEIAAAEVVESKAPARESASERDRFACAVLAHRPAYPSASVIARQLQRQHIGTPWIQATPETLVADTVAIPVLEPRGPYIAATDRLGIRALDQTVEALYDRRSLVLFRCMRGVLHVVRSDALPVVAAATGRAVRHHSARFLGSRGVSARHYEIVAGQVLDALAEGSLSVRAIRERLRPHVDLSAVLAHMCNEGLALRDLPEDGPFGHRTRYVRFDHALPGVRLDALDEDAAARDLVRAYVRAYAPVTEADVAWWTGLGPRRAAQALHDLGDELVLVSVEGFDQPAFVHLADADELESAAIAARPAVALLPAGDALLASRRQRSLFVPDAVRRFVFDARGRSAPAILVDGTVRGVWDLAVDGALLLHAASALSKAERRAVEARAEALTLAFGANGAPSWTSDAPEVRDAPLHVLAHPLST
ncbi:winged helix DNA-binding domain-containing protein [Coriobacteriia bacterium Es71-Z0120]|uniref:winged helix DNA-binding domain-containing protein n=1 Tax=Parvivirga hydrogeniphila TaxID=2939460 RepID=UPI002260EB02|nr:winged helix DNA-binding domain-containing protein [Parvivirga hydrogeniphila]MCL4078077.1 winged helix DNA-binding domain-containing protein [Parvivirga hydrogeniphila]